MAVDYDDNNKFKALVSILEDYTEWFGFLALYVAYSGEEAVPENFLPPTSFTDWLEGGDITSEISPAVIQPIVDIHSAMRDVATDMISGLKRDEKPKHQDFIELKNLYSSFLSSIRRLEKDSAMKGDGMDDLTGLRPSEAVKQDLDKEMQRLSRNGNPFSLVMLHIDNFSTHNNRGDVISVVAANIKKCMRPFDDAYYLDEGLFLMSLKHADMVGAEVAATRIQHALSTDTNNVNKATISCCMSEPVTGDEFSILLKNMKKDLNTHADEPESVLKFLDISPLERFIGTQE